MKNNSWASAKPLWFALQARVAHETADLPVADTHWTAAVQAAGADRHQLELLQDLSVRWKWSARNAALLWQLADNPQTQQGALRALFRHYREERDTRGLYRSLLRLGRLTPDDLAVQNNLAQVSLLLDADSAKARDAACELHRKDPQNPAFASTYAFALFRGGDPDGALRAMQSLTPAQLKDPAVALYYGVILSGSKRKPEARPYLDLGARAELLPEEEILLARAASDLARR